MKVGWLCKCVRTAGAWCQHKDSGTYQPVNEQMQILDIIGQLSFVRESLLHFPLEHLADTCTSAQVVCPVELC